METALKIWAYGGALSLIIQALLILYSWDNFTTQMPQILTRNKVKIDPHKVMIYLMVLTSIVWPICLLYILIPSRKPK